MKVLVCGDRNWQDKEVMRRRLASLPLRSTVIHGAARGADRMAGELAPTLGHLVWEFPADWARYGRAAGPIRNRQMLEEGKPHLVLAFHTDLPSSRGTKNMVETARKAGVPVRVYP